MGNRDIIGRGWNFPAHIGGRGQVDMADGDSKIRQSIRIILNTAPGERVMRPEFGCRIHEVLFWPANASTAAVVERYVEEALGRWEPRIRVQDVRVMPGQFKDAPQEGSTFNTDSREPGKSALFIEIDYQIKGQHDLRSLVYPFYLTPA